MELPALPVLVQRVLQALAVLVLQAPQVQELQAPLESKVLLAPLAQLAYKALQVLVLPAQRGCKALLVLTERQAQRVPALTAPLVQLEQPAQEPQVQPAPLALRVLKERPAPSASALAQQVQLVQELRVQRACKVQQGLQGLTAQQVQLVSGQPACRVLLELLELPEPQELQASLEPLGPQVQEPLEPRDHKDFLLASLTTTQKRQQQVAIQAMDLFCGIMPRKLMQHNYWLAT